MYSFRINVVENVTRTMQRVLSSTRSVSAATSAYQQVLDRLPKSINQLEAELKELQIKQKQSFDPAAVKRYANEIESLQRKIRGLKGGVVVPKVIMPNTPVAPASGSMMAGVGAVAARYAAPAAAGYAAYSAVSGSLSKASEYEANANALRFASGSAEKYQQNLDFLNKTVNVLGLNLERSMEGFKGLQASMMNGSLASEAQNIFKGVSVAVSSMGLSAEKTDRVYLALGQIASKGKVQAEELRGQIGEALPDAFGIAARAMGVTEAKLNKMMDDGELMANDFLPKFAKAMETEFAGGLEKSTQSAQANWNRWQNTLLRTEVWFGSVMMPAAIKALQYVTSGLEKVTGWFQSNTGRIGVWIDRVKKSAQIVYTEFMDIYGPLLRIIGSGIKWLWEGFKTVWSAVAGWIAEHQAQITWIWDTWKLALKAIMGGVIVLVKIVYQIFKAFWWVITTVYYVWMKTFGKIYGWIADAWMAIFGQLYKWLYENIMKPILTFFSNIYEMTGKKLETSIAVTPEILKPPQSVFEQLGIADPSRGKGGKGSNSANVGVQDKIDSVKGGEGVKNFYLNITKLVEKIDIHTTSVREGATDMKNAVEDALLRAVNDIQIAK